MLDNPVIGVPEGSGVHLAVFLGRHPVDVLLLKEDLTDQDTLQVLQAYTIDVFTKPLLSDLDSAGSALTELVRVREPAPAAAEGAGKQEG